MGKVLPGDLSTERRMTPTDAAIASPFLDTLLSRAAPLPDDPQDQALIAGFHFGARIEDRRVLCMALEAQSYEVVHVSLDIAGGVQQGNLMLCLPRLAAEAHPDHRTSADADAEGGEQRPASSATLSETVLNLRADLRIALAHIRMPLRSLSRLEVGSVIDLGNADFDKARVQTVAGAPVGRGVLGQLEGMRAVQMVDALTTGKKPTPQTMEAGMRAADNAPARDRALSDLPDLSEPPRLSMTGADTAEQGVAEMPDMSDMPDLPDLTDLPDLPDMSDLPDFDDMPPFNAMKAG